MAPGLQRDGVDLESAGLGRAFAPRSPGVWGGRLKTFPTLNSRGKGRGVTLQGVDIIETFDVRSSESAGAPSCSREAIAPFSASSRVSRTLGNGQCSMSTMRHLSANRVPHASLTVPLLLCSAAWFAALSACFARGAFQGNWSSVPLGCLLVLTITPAVSFGLGMIVFDGRNTAPLSVFVRFTLAAASVPVTLGTVVAVWALKTLI